MAKLSLILFGTFRLAHGARDIPIVSDKARALLAYLAIECDRAQRRETLTGLLWPGYVERSARHSLSQTLSILHAAVTSVAGSEAARALFTRNRATVQLNLDACCVDAVEFAVLLGDRSAAPVRDAVRANPGPADPRQALSLYHGDLLAGFSLRDSPEFEEWLLVQRERCKRMASRAAGMLAFKSANDEALRYARLWVDLDPLDEEAHRRVMGLLAGSGRRSLAMAQYEACQRTLRAELGVLPDEETQSLLERIRAGDPALVHGPPALTTPAEPRAPPAFLSGPER